MKTIMLYCLGRWGDLQIVTASYENRRDEKLHAMKAET